MKPLMTPGWDDIGDRRSQWIQMFARMKPGFTVASAQASLQPLFTQILREELTQPRAEGHLGIQSGPLPGTERFAWSRRPTATRRCGAITPRR